MSANRIVPATDIEERERIVRRRIVTIFVVVMLLLTALEFVMLTRQGGRSGPPDEEVVEGSTVIRGDVTWTGRVGSLERPVTVRSGGRLVLQRCNLTVPLEDLYIDGSPWFTVDAEGTLRFEGSTLSIAAPEPLKDIYFFSRLSQLDEYLDNGPNMFYRAVDLEGSLAPHLVLDIDARGRSGSLIVAVMAAPESPIEIIQTFDVGGDPSIGWERVDCSLSQFAGSIVMLAIASSNPGLAGAMLKDVRVMDGPGELPRDSFPTNRMDEDGWGLNYVTNLYTQMNSSRWADLIVTGGRLEVRDSIIGSPALPRTWRTNEDWNLKTPMMSMGRPWNLAKLAEGGDITVGGGSILIDGSAIYNVTVRALGSTVEVLDSRLVADRETLTMFECDGRLVGSSFRSAYGIESDYNRYFELDEPLLWAASLWGQRSPAPFGIVDCSFQDSVIGVDLAHASANISGCRFVNCSSIAVWDHDSTGLGDWGPFNSSNDFVACKGMWFLRTHDCEVEFGGLNAPTNWQDGDIQSWGEVSATDGWCHPYASWCWVSRADVDLYMPTLLVNRSGEPSRPSWIELDLWTSWGGRRTERVMTDERVHTASFTGEGITPAPSPSGFGEVRAPDLEMETVEPVSTGVIRVKMPVIVYESYSQVVPAPVHDLQMDVYLGTEKVRTVDVEEEGAPREYGGFDVEFNMTLPVGTSHVNVSLTALPDDGTARVPLDSTDICVVRLCEPASWQGVYECLDASCTSQYIMLDPGVGMAIDGGDLPPEPTEAWGVPLLLCDGSDFTLRDIARADLLYLYLLAYGDGDIFLENLDVPGVTLYTPGCNVTISNSSMEGMELWTPGSNLTFFNVSSRLVWCWASGADVEVERSRITIGEDDVWYTASANLTMADSILVGDGVPLRLQLGGCDVALDNLTVEGVDLIVDMAQAWGGNLSIMDCKFSGMGPGLDFEGVREGPGPPGMLDGFVVSGNRFVGPRSGIEAPEPMFDGWLGPNELADGAGLRVWYEADVYLSIPLQSPYAQSYELSVMTRDAAILGYRVTQDRFRANVQVLRGVDGFSKVGEMPLVHASVRAGFCVQWFIDVEMGTGETRYQIAYWGNVIEGMQRMMRSLWDFG